jgi:hypothetical protein
VASTTDPYGHILAFLDRYIIIIIILIITNIILCGLVVRVIGYRSGGPGSIPGTTRKEK